MDLDFRDACGNSNVVFSLCPVEQQILFAFALLPSNSLSKAYQCRMGQWFSLASLASDLIGLFAGGRAV